MSVENIETIFGTLDSKQLETLKSGIKEISYSFERMNSEKENIKAVIDSLKEETNLPKKIIRKIAKIYFESNFDEISTEFNEIESIYTTVIKE